jgi:hypothetical protein
MVAVVTRDIKRLNLKDTLDQMDQDMAVNPERPILRLQMLGIGASLCERIF